jgi:hypothetical protein
VAVSLLVAFLLAGTLHGPAAAPAVCSSTALLAGDVASVTAVGAALRQRGIHGTRAASCAGVRVTIARCDAGLRLERTNPSGRITARVVATADTAALLIESWLRTDIAAPLLAAHAIEEQPAAPPVLPVALVPAPALVSAIPEPAPGPSAGEAPVVVQASPPAAVARSAGTAMAMLGEAAVVHDGSRAWGGSLSSCVGVRALCVGLTARLARLSMVTDVSDLSRGLDTVEGYDTEGLIGADVPLRFGRLAVRPGGGAGVGWVRTRGPFFEHRADFDSVGLRAEARLELDLRVSRTLALELGLSGGAGATSTIGRVEGSKDRPLLISHLSPLVRAGLGFRFGSGGP